MSQAQLIKDASVVPIGGSKEETKQAVKNLFRANKERYKKLTLSDIDELDRLHDENEAELVF